MFFFYESKSRLNILRFFGREYIFRLWFLWSQEPITRKQGKFVQQVCAIDPANHHNVKFYGLRWIVNIDQ